MLQWEHSAILLTFIKLPFVTKTFVLTFFEWLLKTSFTVCAASQLPGGGPTDVDNGLLSDKCKQQYFAIHD